MLDAPGGGYFDVVYVVASVKSTRDNFYDVNDRWLQSDWTQRRMHLFLDQLFCSPWGYGFSGPGHNDGMSFTIGWSHL